jgi:hypothetical protein
VFDLKAIAPQAHDNASGYEFLRACGAVHVVFFIAPEKKNLTQFQG